MRPTFVATAFSFVASTLAMNGEARALGPVDVEVGAKAGLATSPERVGSVNPLGLGLGARGGVDFLGFYAGLQFVYYFGRNGNEPLSCGVAISGCGSVALSTHTVLYGIEAGYGLTLARVLTIRPQIGLGNATFSSSGTGPNNSLFGGSDSHPYLEPGVTGLVSPGRWFVGVDVDLFVFLGRSASQPSFAMNGQAGFKF
jgi:hypothetical protein